MISINCVCWFDYVNMIWYGCVWNEFLVDVIDEWKMFKGKYTECDNWINDFKRVWLIFHYLIYQNRKSLN